MEIKLLSCPLCSKPHFEGVDSLRSTLISVATSQLACPVCNEMLLGLDKLTIHLFSHISNSHDKNDGKIVNENLESDCKGDKIEENLIETITDDCVHCDICNFSFNDPAILEMHQKLLHETAVNAKTNNYNYCCHLCTKKFKMRGSLMVHLRVAHYGFGHKKLLDTTGIESTNINVTNTKSEDTATSNLEKESGIKKLGNINKIDNKQWECDVCSKMFTTKYFLKKHKRLHTGEMPYVCLQCNKSFTFQQSYHKHMLYHSSEKPHVCTECGRAFKELSTLHNHERIHSGERPFACETCGKCFRQRVSYLVHRRIHTGVMPYKCTACDKSFRYKVSQRSHKCPANPPGSVIKAPNLIEKLSMKFVNSNSTTSTSTQDQNIISNEQNHCTSNNGSDAKNISVEHNKNTFFSINILDSPPNYVSTESPDFFSMMLSPLVPEVQSLCLSPVETVINDDKLQGPLQTINEESLKEMLYGLSK